MPRQYNEEQTHNIKTANKSFQNEPSSNSWERHQQIQILYMKKLRVDKIR